MYGARVVATPERRVKDKCVKVLRRLGAYYFFPAASPYGRRGIPDLIACYRGKFIGIECKAGRNKATKLQVIELDKIETAGGASRIVDDETDWDELEGWLRRVASEAQGQGDIPPELASAYLDDGGFQ